MPNGVFPVPKFDSPTPRGPERPSLRLRFRTWRKRRRLDDELARGVGPSTSDELALRAAQLRSSQVRLRLATRLLAKLDEARAREGLSLKLQPHRREIRDAADDLMALVLRLQDGRPVSVQGMAMTARLLTRGKSSFDPYSGESIERALREARVALDDKTASAADLRIAA